MSSFQISVFFLFVCKYTYPGVVLLDHMVVLFLAFWETSILLSTMAASIYIPINVVQRFLFLHILANICYSQVFFFFFLVIDSHSDRCGLVSHCGLFAFFWWLTMLSIFPCAYWPSECLLWKIVYLGLLKIVLAIWSLLCFNNIFENYLF